MIDYDKLGRCLKAARILAGIDSASELSAILSAMDCDASPRSIYSYERGQSKPPLDYVVAVIALLAERTPRKADLRMFLDVLPPQMASNLLSLSGS